MRPGNWYRGERARDFWAVRFDLAIAQIHRNNPRFPTHEAERLAGMVADRATASAFARRERVAA
ncbi:hypothetical protein [Hwanghaeella sp.]|uniref:hypothetical protein n=1 Tax=Hwanghaeella sp. TaxID=2605943 RepID=UPI003CCBE5D6